MGGKQDVEGCHDGGFVRDVGSAWDRGAEGAVLEVLVVDSSCYRVVDCVKDVEGFVGGCFGGGSHLVNYWVLMTRYGERVCVMKKMSSAGSESKLLPRRGTMMLVSKECFEPGNLPWKYREIKRPLNKELEFRIAI